MNDEQHPLTADPQVARDWLTHLYSGCPGFLSICSDADGWVGRRFTTDEPGIAAAVEYAIAMDGRGAKGVYAQTTTLREKPAKGRGGEDLAYGLTHLWGDGDYGTIGHKPGLDDLPAPPDADAVAKVVAESGLPEPSGWAHSGGGYNPVWALAENYVIASDEDRVRVKELTTGLQAILAAQAYHCGWSWDSEVGNLDRLMKVPGTVNRKEGLERPTAIGPGTGELFDLADLAKVVAQLAPAARETMAQAAMERQQRKAARLGHKVPPPRAPRQPRPASGDGPLDVLADMWEFRDVLVPAGFTYEGTHGDGREKWLRPAGSGERASSAYSLVCDDHVAVNWSERSDLPVGALAPGQKLTIGTLYAHLNYGGDTSEAARDIMRAAAGRTAHGAAERLPAPVLAEVKRRCLKDSEPAVATFNDYLAQSGLTDAGLNAVRHHGADDSTRKPEPTQGSATLSESPNMRLPETFWSKSPQLAAIREAARRRHNSPEMLMVIVLTRIAALCGPTVRVATGAGDPATLSVFGSGVGESGSGKGRGDKTGRKLVPFDYKTLGEDFVSIGISTGRGITAAFLAKKEVQLGHPDFDEEADAKGKPQEKRLTQVATRAYATEDEGSTMMAAIQSKHGADIPGTLCKCWIGEEHRQSNATEELRRSLDADSYTMSMFATFQPEPAAELLATGSIGLPQRTLFTLAYRSEEEIEATRDRTEITDADWDDYGDDRQQASVHVAELIAPGTNRMTVAKFAENLRDVVVRLPVAAQREIARMIADGESRETTVHPLDKHRPLQLAKTAAVFALLHGETAVRRIHWEMANDLWGVSVAVRSMIEALAETKVRQAAEARRADAVATSRAVKAAEIEVETGANPVVVRLARKLARKLKTKGPMRSSDAQRGLITGADRRSYQETGADAPLWPAVARYASDSGIVSIDGDGVFSVV